MKQIFIAFLILTTATFVYAKKVSDHVIAAGGNIPALPFQVVTIGGASGRGSLWPNLRFWFQLCYFAFSGYVPNQH